MSQKSAPTEDHETAALMRDQLAQTLREGECHSSAILRQAVIGLGRVGTPEYADLIQLYTHARWEQRLRLAAVHALGGIGGEKATDLLIGLLNDSDLVIQWAAQEMLDKLLTGPAPVEG
jgi:HEAT repeat protein